MFVSDLYRGSVPDKELVRHSGLLDLLESGESFMVHRGFDIEAELALLHLELN